MNCDSVRKALTEERHQNRTLLRQHLSECEACARFAGRLEVAEQALSGHHVNVTPSADFAARVVSKLPKPAPVMAWAALRLLPAAAALLLVLSAWVWLATATPAELTASAPTDDLVSWVLENGEVGE